MVGFSADALTASKRRTVGQGSTGAGTLLGRWDGSKVRVAAMRSLPGLDEVVSMTWRASKPRRVGLHEMVMGVLVGAGTLPRLVIKRAAVCAWFGAGGEARLQALRVVPRGAIAPWSS